MGLGRKGDFIIMTRKVAEETLNAHIKLKDIVSKRLIKFVMSVDGLSQKGRIVKALKQTLMANNDIEVYIEPSSNTIYIRTKPKYPEVELLDGKKKVLYVPSSQFSVSYYLQHGEFSRVDGKSSVEKMKEGIKDLNKKISELRKYIADTKKYVNDVVDLYNATNKKLEHIPFLGERFKVDFELSVALDRGVYSVNDEN